VEPGSSPGWSPAPPPEEPGSTPRSPAPDLRSLAPPLRSPLLSEEPPARVDARRMAVGVAPLAAAMCMLTQTTSTQEEAGGAVMSDVISMHSGVVKLLGDGLLRHAAGAGLIVDQLSYRGTVGARPDVREVGAYDQYHPPLVSLRAREERVSKRYDDEQRVVWAAGRRARRVELDEQPGSTVDDLHHAGAPRLVRGRL